ncbi:MAG: hypothetical protein EBR40_12100 [Proteobacteria bacterium]|nr:hypothetical protein [Pseudomonadota bacterium]
MAKAPQLGSGGFGSLLEKHSRSQPGGRCSIGAILEDMDDKDAADFRLALADRKTYSSSSLARALNEYGYKTSHSSVQRHRTKGCQCE